MDNKTFVKLLKKHTTIDTEFIDTFFKKFKIGDELDFEIKDTDVAKYLGIKLKTVRDRLLNIYSKYKHFYEKVDFIKIKSDTSNAGITYMLNYPCFEKLAIGGETEESETVRMYFVKLSKFLIENQHAIYQSMENQEDLRKLTDEKAIYFFVIDERHPDIMEYGHTQNIIQRLNNYNIGRIKEIDLKYLAVVKHSKLIEHCIKLNTRKNQIKQNKEILKINPKELKKIIEKCYCKYVDKKQNEELYEELSILYGLYSYAKNKVNFKPYVIIDK